MTTIPSSPLILNAGIGMRRKLLVLDANGLATIELADHGTILQVPPGATLHGLRLVNNGDDFLFDDDIDYAVNVVTIGGTSVLVHDSPFVAAQYRLRTSDGGAAGSDVRRYFIFYSKASGSWRWEVSRWF